MLVVVALLLSVQSAPGAESTAKAHFDRATALFQDGDFARARVEYQAAFELEPHPGFLFNIGQCHRRLGDIDSAIATFRRYLAVVKNPSERTRIHRLLEELEALPVIQTSSASASKQEEAVPALEPPLSQETVLEEPWFWAVVIGVSVVALGGTLIAVSGGSEELKTFSYP